MYFSPAYLKMLVDYHSLAKESGAGRAGLAYRWVEYHSALKESLGDSMIIGASTAHHLESSVAELEKGPLEKWVVHKIDELWKIV